ncbi:NAD-dependent epimerase/dehydratase family protein [Aquibium sp. LZ166]|uniref:NAD-dependent epimerase/dehydratase family protein n=1 Tax=Aquibium pacificus TaxID=3153579 RepID=A0ABV3SJD6_9HYPH
MLTGASGFIGGVVGRTLMACGYGIRAVSREPAKLGAEYAETARLPDPDSGTSGWKPLLAGVTHVVHCAGENRALAYELCHEPNVALPGRLARAAADVLPGRFVLLSSVRAVSDGASGESISESSAEAPLDDYGRSKLEGEKRVQAALGPADRCFILRPAPVYGPGSRGSFRVLTRLASLPLPLPLSGLTTRRSLVDVESLAEAARHVLRSPLAPPGVYMVADLNPLTVPEIVAAVRKGLGRGPGVFSVSPSLLRLIARASGQEGLWRRLSEPLLVDPSRLATTGWQPVADTAERISRYARRGLPAK